MIRRLASGLPRAALLFGLITSPVGAQGLGGHVSDAPHVDNSVYMTQYLLHRLGFLGKIPDGFMDSDTSQAITDFLKSRGQVPDRSVVDLSDELLRSIVNGVSDKLPKPVCEINKHEVKETQEILLKMGFRIGQSDGVCTQLTGLAIASFLDQSQLPAAATIDASVLFNLRLARESGYSSDIVRILNWPEYTSPDVLYEIARNIGIRIVYRTFSSSDELTELVVSGQFIADVVFPTAHNILHLISIGKLQKIDRSGLPGLRNIDPRLMAKISASYDSGNAHSVPYMWGQTDGLCL